MFAMIPNKDSEYHIFELGKDKKIKSEKSVCGGFGDPNYKGKTAKEIANLMKIEYYEADTQDEEIDEIIDDIIFDVINFSAVVLCPEFEDLLVIAIELEDDRKNICGNCMKHFFK